MAQQYGGKHVKVWHTIFPGSTAPTLISRPLLFLRQLFQPYTTAEKLESNAHNGFRKKDYFSEQSTQPQTLGYSLSDSPVTSILAHTVLAWIYELVNWTDDYPWSDDEVRNFLIWVSIYYFSRAGPTASTRIYFEVTHGEDNGTVFGQAKNPSRIPMGASYFPKDVMVPPRSWVRTTGNLVFESEHSSGGHFAAYEKPNELVEDLRNMFGRKKKGKGEVKGPAFGVVSGRNGFQPA
ncbi:alpha/beta-hydrolase [Dendrothele bispora CBS 962.96]|uniref:Alpha/beta-hydrolase n=1 Tax=Dendrothele bispora (strain CBS 962.96) TaxID=1314807 RepID=A0A4S8LRL2_DENBC|nr:alpha/beta-hydrolase [Dendrothele bispora CBS 962.96]